MFLLIVLGSWTLMHGYVLARLWGLPILASPPARRALVAAALLLWASVPLARLLATRAAWLARPLEVVGSVWLGVIFLLVVCLLAADVLTGFGWLFPARTPSVRLGALGLAACLSLIGLVQGLRPPVVREQEVAIRNLRPELDGLVVVQISDLHLGHLLSAGWLERRARQIESLRPDLIAATGDLLDMDSARSESLVPALRRLHAPLGVWAVTGNHEFYAGVEHSVKVLGDAGFRVLRDVSEEAAPGLIIAGVDDLTARRQFGLSDDPVAKALGGRPPGATILLCHSPWKGEEAARLGVDLMLSGHTHAGQIWPFTYIVQLTYPHVVGRYVVGGMTWLVTRGTGFWGPPMRLFRPAEILRITLRRASS